MKFSGRGRGDSEPTLDDIEQEAADELRRAIGGAGQVRGSVPSYKEARNMAADAAGADDDYDHYDDYGDYGDYQPMRRPSADDERRMATDLAMQQLAERPQGRNRAGASSRPMPSGDPEDLRNRALAAALERQRRMQQSKAPDDPATPRPNSLDVHGAQSRVQRVSGANITPSISAKPTLGGFHAPPSDAVPLHKPVAEALAGATFGGPGRTSAPGRQGTAPGGAGRMPAPVRPGVTPAGGARRGPAPRPATEMDELEEVIARADEGQALPAVAKWLSDEVESSVAFVLVVDEALDDFVAWPTDSVIAQELMQVVEQPLDHHSTIWTAMAEGRPLSNRDGVLVMPDGAEAEGCEWLVVPMVIDSEPLGAVFVTRGEGDTYSPAGVKFIESIADRLAEVLVEESEDEEEEPEEDAVEHRTDARSAHSEPANVAGHATPTGATAVEDRSVSADVPGTMAEPVTAAQPGGVGEALAGEAGAAEGRTEVTAAGGAADENDRAGQGRDGTASGAPADGDKRVDGALPDAVRDWLIALRVVLDGFGAAPSVPMPEYRDIVGGARSLRDQILELLTLTGPGGPGRGAES